MEREVNTSSVQVESEKLQATPTATPSISCIKFSATDAITSQGRLNWVMDKADSFITWFNKRSKPLTENSP